MPRNLTQKLFPAHRADGRLEPGEEIGIRADQILMRELPDRVSAMDVILELLGDGTALLAAETGSWRSRSGAPPRPQGHGYRDPAGCP